MKSKHSLRSKLANLYLAGAVIGGLVLPLSLSGQSQWTYDFNHLEPGPLDGRDGWSASTSTRAGLIYSTNPSGAYPGGNAIGMDGPGLGGTYIGGRAGLPDFKDATSITTDVYLGPDNGRNVRVFGITGTPFTNAMAGMMFGCTGGNNFNLRGAGFGSTIVSETWGLPDTWYRLTLTWSEPDGAGNRDVVFSGYDLTNGAPVGNNGVLIETTVSEAFFGPDPSNYVGFGVRADGDGIGSALVASVTRTGHGTAPVTADFGSTRFIKFQDLMPDSPFALAPVSEGDVFYRDVDDVVTTLPPALSGNLALKTSNDFSGQAHLFDGVEDFVRLEGTREEFQHFLRGEGKASFTVKYDEILATGVHYSRSFFLSANGNIQADHADFNVGVSQAGNWWVSLSTAAGGQNYAVLEMDITPKPEVGVWYDVEVDLDAGTFSVNGDVLRTFTPVNTLAPGADILPWQNDFHFGFTPNHSRHFKGEMTEVKFEDGAGNITGHWRLDQADDYVVADLSGNGHDGTVSGRARPLEDLASYIGFTVDRPTTVYVAYDDTATVPAWLQNHFTPSGMQVATTAGAFDLWERALEAREQVSLLFDNTVRQPGDNNYWVILGEGPDAMTSLADSAFFRTGEDWTWRLDAHHWTLTPDGGSSSDMAAMITSLTNFDPAQGFELSTNIRVPRLQDSGNNAFGFVALGDGTSTGIRAEWLPRAGDGLSRIQLVEASSGAVLAQAPWNGLVPTVVDNDAGPADRTGEVLFQEGTPAFTGEGPLLAEGFEDGAMDWTSGSYNSTPDQWEIGVPTSGPGSAFEGLNVAATRLDRGYDSVSQSWLRSPVIDLTDVPDAKLTFHEYSDVDTDVVDGQIYHYATVSVLNADTLNPIEELARYSEDITTWQERELDLSAFAGQRVVLEFGFYNDDFMEFAGDGWYLDDIQVTQGVQRNILSMPESLALDGTLYGLPTDHAGINDTSDSHLQFTVADRATAGNDGVTVFVAWDARAAGLEPNWLRDTFTLTGHSIGVSGGAGHHRLWAREVADGTEVTLGGASAPGGGPFVEGTNNYFVLFADSRPGLETLYTLTTEGAQENGEWNLSFSLDDNSGNAQTVSATTAASPGGNSFGLFARHPDAAGGTAIHAPIWETFDLSIDVLGGHDGTGFEAWRAEHFEGQLDNLEISGPNASPAGDGVTNLMKYALDLPPWMPVAAADLPQFSLDGEGRLILVYWERTDIDDIDYIPEVSEDLILWNSGPPHVTELLREAGDQPNLQEVAVQGNVSAEAGRGFLRLRVQQK